jgi:hypothetical protein
MRTKISALALGLAAMATLAGGASRADAAAVNISGNGALGDFTGSLDLTGSTLTLVINNTSPVDNGGYITGIAFSGAGSASASATSLPANWVELTGPVSIAPFGDAEFGVALDSQNPSWLGGGSPQDGIAVGGSAMFVFATTGSTDVNDFAGGLYVRFRGFEDEGSDKVPGTPDEPPPPPPAVPLPAAAWMGLTTLGGLAVRQYRRSRA